VQNVTDIDDPLLDRAQETGVGWKDLAQSQTDLYRSDMEALSVIPPTHFVGVVESMHLVVEGVQQMLEAGAAYWVGPDLYADLSADNRFGSIGKFDRATQLEFFSERGGDPDTPGKRDPLDPLLWRGKRDAEPAWDGGVLGWGRPGWHIECAIIARRYLDVPFVLQGGGEDLVFPHHEMSLSHLRILTDTDHPAEVNMHAALLAYKGEKMSKSLGNLVFVSGLRELGVEPDVIRLLLLDQHYRHEWEYTQDKLSHAQQRFARWQDAMATDSNGSGPTGEQVLETVRGHLANDLDTASALKAVDQWAESGRKTTADRRLVADLTDGLFGVKKLTALIAAS
ncbi:MAG TPA: class I tRNA ligase family protein, partial [Beutenbergiaceae bacterium]|nr:class I tRNA ligase family protein [Beutenbergiaceae bacterium]